MNSTKYHNKYEYPSNLDESTKIHKREVKIVC